jgi:hypothetical protein
MILEKEVKVGLNPRNIQYYQNLGYTITRVNGKFKKGTKIFVKLEDLEEGSNVKVTKLCDIEGCSNSTSNQKYNQILTRRKEGDGLDRCVSCGRKQNKVTRRKNMPYEDSFEYKAIYNNKEYLLEEFSSKNKEKPSEIPYMANENYLWGCKKCGGEYLAKLSNKTCLDNKCPYCSNYRTLKGFNDLWTTRPDIAKLLKTQQRGFEISRGSSIREDFICPNCDYVLQSKCVADVVNYGLSCRRCSDGFYYPEKIMMNMLTQLEKINGITFETQMGFKWSKNIYHEDEKLKGDKKYDFYIPSLNCIVETHGIQHYKKSFDTLGGKTLDEEQENDKLKEKLAKENGIENYIIIDCSYSDIKYIQDSILKDSLLPQLIDLSNINWNKCHEFACSSMVKEVCDLWNSGVKNTAKIGKLVKLQRASIIRYLKKGRVLGWVDYDPKEEMRKSSLISSPKRKKPIVQLTLENELIKEFPSATDAGKEIGHNYKSISSVCKGKQKSAYGYKWMFKADYENIR